MVASATSKVGWNNSLRAAALLLNPPLWYWHGGFAPKSQWHKWMHIVHKKNYSDGMLYCSLITLHIEKLFRKKKLYHSENPQLWTFHSGVSSTKVTIQLSFFYFSKIQTWGICTGAIRVTLDNYLLNSIRCIASNPFGSSCKDPSISPICYSLQTHIETIFILLMYYIMVSWNKRWIKWIKNYV
jgi:hypothetical protein